MEENCIGDDMKYPWAANSPDVLCFEGHIQYYYEG